MVPRLVRHVAISCAQRYNGRNFVWLAKASNGYLGLQANARYHSECRFKWLQRIQKPTLISGVGLDIIAVSETFQTLFEEKHAAVFEIRTFYQRWSNRVCGLPTKKTISKYSTVGK